MKRCITLILAALLVTLSGCGAPAATEAEFSVACTTYPVYLLANTIAGDTEGVAVTLVIDQQVSCLHDYSLTVSDMKAIEAADVVAINGAGLEDFLDDVLVDRTVIDCSEGVLLLEPSEEEAEHDHSEHHHHDEEDPHIWMDPLRYAQMARNLASALAEADPAHGETYLQNGEACAAELERFNDELRDHYTDLEGKEIITFHDGFTYFAAAFNLHIVDAIEEEEGAEVSAKALKETIAIVEEHGLPAVFTEVNGSMNAATVIRQECGVKVGTLSMLMSGRAGDTVAAYETGLRQNLETIMEAYR